MWSCVLIRRSNHLVFHLVRVSLFFAFTVLLEGLYVYTYLFDILPIHLFNLENSTGIHAQQLKNDSPLRALFFNCLNWCE